MKIETECRVPGQQLPILFQVIYVASHYHSKFSHDGTILDCEPAVRSNRLQQVCTISANRSINGVAIAYGIGFVHSTMGRTNSAGLDYSILCDLAKGKGQEAGVPFGIPSGFHYGYNDHRFCHAHLFRLGRNAAVFFHKNAGKMIKQTNQLMI